MGSVAVTSKKLNVILLSVYWHSPQLSLQQLHLRISGKKELGGDLPHALAFMNCLNSADANGGPLSDTTVMRNPLVANMAQSFSVVCCMC